MTRIAVTAFQLTAAQTQTLYDVGRWVIDHAAIPLAIWGYHRVKVMMVDAKHDVIEEVTNMVQSHFDNELRRHEADEKNLFAGVHRRIAQIESRKS